MADARPATDGGDRGEGGVDWARIGRVWVLIGLVTAILLFTAATRAPGEVFATAVVGIGGVALVTAITGFLIGAASGLET